ncbi:putative membrane protein [Kushneria sinocarnis]|uniref:Putative membrane protein n=1 Tax=Kushneria sinocarnis TaxID=595502 RepID=A0A420WT32_9GAMM|nr:DMT family transporter [Kushneria sinocarnis]RKQ96262.1 putative membrane protein [Kushneria sinocarnis]
MAEAGTSSPHSQHRRSIDMTASALMTLFCLALGFQQVAIKAVAMDIPPLVQVALRSTMAALPVMLLMRWRGIPLASLLSHARPGVLVGLGFAAEFLFVAWGLNYTLASHMSVFLYTAPVFAALGLHWLVPGEQLRRPQWWGVALAFTGMVIAMAPTPTRLDEPALLLGDALGLLAGLAWAATTLVLRSSTLSEAPPEQTLCYQLVVAGALLLPAALLFGAPGAIHLSGPAIASLAFQTLVISFGALLLWFALLRRYKASQLGIFSFLSPLFGVLFGALLLDEPLTLNFMLGGLVMLGGIVLVSR